ncbi:MAG: 30S ribosome-binding factor RbfA [Parvularculales bacterium]
MTRRFTSSASVGAPSQRCLRVGELLRQVLCEIVRSGSLYDRVLEKANITITEVRVSPDLKNATVFVITLGGHHVEEAVAALMRVRGALRYELGCRIRLKNTPALSFVVDRSFENVEKMNRLLASTYADTASETGQ